MGSWARTTFLLETSGSWGCYLSLNVPPLLPKRRAVTQSGAQRKSRALKPCALPHWAPVEMWQGGSSHSGFRA